MTTEKDTVHLWFRPFNGVLNDPDIAYLDRYSKWYYPRAMGKLTKQLHQLAGKITAMTTLNSFEYQLMHFTKGSAPASGQDRRRNSRYVIQEYVRDANDAYGLNIALQPTTYEERIKYAFVQSEEFEARTTSIEAVVAYFEDVLENESHKWSQIRMKDGQEALPVLLEIISFLKSVKKFARVDQFEIISLERGESLTLTLLAPGVLSYYLRFDWVIQ